MENVLSVANGIALFAGALGAAISVIYVVYSGYLFMSAEGDPQKMARARTSLIGVVIGIVLIGGAFIIPGTISRYVIEPAGGVRIDPRARVDCDGVLKDQLVFQRNVSSPDKMQFLIAQVQGQRSDCSADMWNPVVRKRVGHPPGCFESDDEVSFEGALVPGMGGVAVPSGLRDGGDVRDESSRDPDNNIIVYWVHPSDTTASVTGLPSDGAVCWMHVAAFSSWTEDYCPPGNQYCRVGP